MNEKPELQSIDSISDAAWQKLAQKKIFFGHQSVGNNIIDGINKIMRSSNIIRLRIIKTTDPAAFVQPIFAHSDVGKNDDTDSKINGFEEYMNKGIGNKADIAFFKFCFWDIRRHTDIKTVFMNYKIKLAELEKKYPKTTFIHFTVPLMSYENDIIHRIKRLLHIEIGTDSDNIRRNQLNNLIIQEYNGKEPVFDIAAAESTLPGAARAAFTKDGKTYYVLAHEYTNDGGHLNERGQKVVAEQFLIFLAKLSGE